MDVKKDLKNISTILIPANRTKHGKKSSGYVFILILAAVTIISIAYLKSQESPVKPELPLPKPTVNYSQLIQTHTDQASRRNLNALHIYEMNINRIYKEYEPKLSGAAQKAAREAADYGSCGKIIWFLASDKVTGQHTTEEYLNSQIMPFLDPVFRSLRSDINVEIRKFDNDLRDSSVQLAYDLAALGPAQYASDTAVDFAAVGRSDFQRSLRNLGFNVAGIGVSGAFDAVALYNSRFVVDLWQEITDIAARMFGREVEVATASAAAAVADGPLPIGDCILLGGITWTGYDIYTSQKKFEKDINTSLDNQLAEVCNSLHKQAFEQATAMLTHYQKIQDNIGSQALEHTINGGE